MTSLAETALFGAPSAPNAFVAQAKTIAASAGLRQPMAIEVIVKSF
jgi:hypothetical protein